MRWCVFVLLALAAIGQERVQTYTFDGAGYRLTGPQTDISVSATGSNVTQKLESINGRMVPLEKAEERVLQDTPQGKVVERISRAYDQNGNPGPPVRTLIEEQKRPDGSVTTTAKVYRGDINGNMALAERDITETHKTATGSIAETVVERPSINNSLATAEKRSTVTEKRPDGESSNTIVQRKDPNGNFYDAVRQTVERQQTKDQTVDNTAVYVGLPTGGMRLEMQTVQQTATRPDGSSSTQVDIYSLTVPGVAYSADNTTPKLKEQQAIEKRVTPAGTVETVMSRHPTLTNPERLGPPVKIAETVCTGTCK